MSYLLVNRRHRWFQDLAPVLLSYRQHLFLVNRLMTDSGHLLKKLEGPYLDPGLMRDSGWALGSDLFQDQLHWVKAKQVEEPQPN